MNVLFVTVGTTAIYNPEIGAVDGRDNGALRADVERYRQSAKKRWMSNRALKDRLVEEHRRYWAVPDKLPYVTNPDNFYQSAGELTSTFALICTPPRDQHPDIGRIVLLPTATDEGRMAGQILHEVMRSPEFDVKVPKREILMEEVAGLETEFTAMHKQLLGAVDRHAVSTDVIWFNVTGGYKGTALIAGIHASERKFVLFYQHEQKEIGILLSGIESIPWKRHALTAK